MPYSRRPGRVRSARRPAGFTIVELITVVILLSILGVVAMGRMVSPDLLAPAIVTEALVAESRFAQQVATSRHDAAVNLTVDRLGDAWRFRVATDVDGVIRTELVEAEDTTVHAASGAVNGSVDAGAALTVSFDRVGDLSGVSLGAVVGDPAAGIGLTIVGDSMRVACIYPSGYANDDACN